MRTIALDKVANATIIMNMSSKRDLKHRIKVDIPFSVDETARLRAFISGTGRKVGPWLRYVALQALDESDGVKPSTEAQP